ncbi:MAG: TSUP family transporter [Propionicimonas sp.]
MADCDATARPSAAKPPVDRQGVLVGTALAIGAAILLGALTQRLTGVGFALIASPLLILILGPLQGVVITNVFGIATASAVYLLHVREVEYAKVLPLLGAAAVAVVPGAMLARALPTPLLAIGAGSLTVLALALSVFARRLPHVDAWPGRVVAGGLSGFMNVVAGVGGPAITAYSIASEWEHRLFAISVQFYFAVLGLISFTVRGVLPAIAAVDWAVAVAALAVGLLAGQLLGRWIPVRVARRACLVLALLGGLAVIARGILDVV